MEDELVITNCVMSFERVVVAEDWRAHVTVQLHKGKSVQSVITIEEFIMLSVVFKNICTGTSGQSTHSDGRTNR